MAGGFWFQLFAAEPVVDKDKAGGLVGIVDSQNVVLVIQPLG